MVILKSRTNQIRKAPIIELLSQVSLPKDVISFGQGIPFFGPPAEAIKISAQSMFQPEGFQYSTDNGLIQLRETIAEKIYNEQKVRVDPERHIMVTSGANQGFMNAILTITQPGDEIIFLSPTYFNYIMAAELAGCKPILVQTNENFQPNISRLQENISKRTKAIVTVSPNNPTGAVYPPKLLKAINELCRDYSLYHISDEVYEYFIYEGAIHKSPLCFDNSISNTISLYSLSKCFAISGYRIGYMIFPEELQDELFKVQDTIGICAPTPSQLAANEIIPMGPAFCHQFFDVLIENRLLVKSMLSEIDTVQIVWTKGAYYFFVTVDSFKSSFNLAKELIEHYGIIVLPGSMFDFPKCSFRLSYGNLSGEKLVEGLNRLKVGLNRLL